MKKGIDHTYRTEKLLDWERKSLTEKLSGFSISDKSTWTPFVQIIFGMLVFGFITPFVLSRYQWRDWRPVATIDEYWYRVASFWMAAPILIFVAFVFFNIRSKIDLSHGIKRIANFNIILVINLLAYKILFMNRWRVFCIKARQPYFYTVRQGQIITIKRTSTYRLIDYFIRDVEKFNIE